MAGGKLQNIIESTDTIKQMSSQIYDGAQRQHSEVIRVHENIDSIRGVIDLIQQTSSIVTVVSQEMDGLTQELTQELGHFKSRETAVGEHADNAASGDVDLF